VIEPFLTGKEYCSYNICHHGNVLAHSTYSVQIAIDGHSCLQFETIEQPAILQWITNFISKENYTGQISFDFIETPDGQLYAIECNPRASSGVHLFKRDDNLATAFFNTTTKLITPKPGICRQIGMGMLLYGWQPNASDNFLFFLQKFLSSSDVIFDKKDLKPFFMQPISLLYLLRLAKKLNLSLPAVFNHDLEWNGFRN
ncbi:MAG: carboxylate--amine ligase, partial [Gammaproteobacteria bacterium]